MYQIPRQWTFTLIGVLNLNTGSQRPEVIKAKLEAIAIEYGLDLAVDNGTKKKE